MIRRDQVVEWLPIVLGIALLLFPFWRFWTEADPIDETLTIRPQTKFVRTFSTRVSYLYDIDLALQNLDAGVQSDFKCNLSYSPGAHNSCAIPKFSWVVSDASGRVESGDNTGSDAHIDARNGLLDIEMGAFKAGAGRPYKFELNLRTTKPLNAFNPRLTISLHPSYTKGDVLFVLPEWIFGFTFLIGGLSLRRRNRRKLPPVRRRFASDTE